MTLVRRRLRIAPLRSATPPFGAQNAGHPLFGWYPFRCRPRSPSECRLTPPPSGSSNIWSAGFVEMIGRAAAPGQDSRAGSLFEVSFPPGM